MPKGTEAGGHLSRCAHCEALARVPEDHAVQRQALQLC